MSYGSNISGIATYLGLFVSAIRSGFQNYFNFKGRACRSEFLSKQGQKMLLLLELLRAISSVGRALRSHRRGRGIEARTAH